MIMKLKPGHAGHMHVGNQTRRALKTAGFEEFIGAGKVSAMNPIEFSRSTCPSQTDGSSSTMETTELWNICTFILVLKIVPGHHMAQQRLGWAGL